jgi:hypothetical protein
MTLGERFEAKVDRSGEHHLWLGAKKADGSGVLKVEGRMATAHRVAWELAKGPLPAGAEVRACDQAKACVRVEHLSVRGGATAGEGAGQAGRRRARKGTGSITWVREGACKLTVTAGRYEDGSPRRLSETVEVDGEVEAVHALARYVSEINDGLLPATKFDRDIVLDDAIERYLDEYLRDEKGRAPNDPEELSALSVWSGAREIEGTRGRRVGKWVGCTNPLARTWACRRSADSADSYARAFGTPSVRVRGLARNGERVEAAPYRLGRKEGHGRDARECAVLVEMSRIRSESGLIDGRWYPVVQE